MNFTQASLRSVHYDKREDLIFFSLTFNREDIRFYFIDRLFLLNNRSHFIHGGSLPVYCPLCQKATDHYDDCREFSRADMVELKKRMIEKNLRLFFYLD